MDGQNKWMHNVMEQYLPAFSNYEQVNWVELLLLVEFAYNISILHSRLMIYFRVNYNTLLQCSITLPRTPDSDHRCRPTCG